MRTCECGCGASLEGRRDGTLYVDRTHGQRAYRKRVDKAMRDKGLEPRVSLRVAKAARPTTKRNGDAKKASDARQTGRKGHSGLQLSWGTAVREVSATLQVLGCDADDAEVWARRILRRALSDKQRARLDTRDA